MLRLKYLWPSVVALGFLIGVFQNCSGGHNSLQTASEQGSEPLAEELSLSSYWDKAPKKSDLRCSVDASVGLSQAEMQVLAQAETNSHSHRHLAVHLQPLEFPQNGRTWREIYSQNFNELKGALKASEASFKLAAGISIFAFESSSACDIEQQLNEAFAQAEAHDLPLIIHVDFEWMLEWRPDIWNWYDAQGPGFNINNRNKVEWSDWDQPIKKFGIFWDAHGLQRKARVCYANPDIQAEVIQKGRFIAAVINQWRLKLAQANKSHLFIAVDPGWETGIQDYRGVSIAKNMGVDYQLGFCALKYEGFSAANLPQDAKVILANVVRKYAELESRVFFEAGIPRQKIFTHIVGTDGDRSTAPHPGRLFYQNSPMEVAFNNYALPGFSLYPGAYYPELVKKHVSGKPWVIAETAFQAFEHLNQFAGDRYLKSINIYSWDMIRSNSSSIQQLKDLMQYPLQEDPVMGPAPSPVVSPSPAPTTLGNITGSVESLSGRTLAGWGCVPGSSKAVSYEIYAGDFSGTKFLAGVGVANRIRGDFQSTCGAFQTIGWSHEFSDLVMKKYQSLGIHVKVKGEQQETWLYKPAPYVIPQSQVSTRVTGAVESLQGDIISGWACSPDFAESVNLDIYAGDFNGNPGLVASTQATVNREDQQHVCGSQKMIGWSYRFSSANRQNFKGLDIHVKAKLFETSSWLYKPSPYVVPSP